MRSVVYNSPLGSWLSLTRISRRYMHGSTSRCSWSTSHTRLGSGDLSDPLLSVTGSSPAAAHLAAHLDHRPIERSPGTLRPSADSLSRTRFKDHPWLRRFTTRSRVARSWARWFLSV
jgi:hypothetical protein